MVVWYILTMRVYIKEVEGLIIPEKAHESDTGFDIYATSDPIILGEKYSANYWKSIDYIYYKTNVFLNLGANEKVYVNLRPRSSNRKMNLLLSNSVGLCDNGYTGEYIASFQYQFQPDDLRIGGNLNDNILGKINYDKIYHKGDKIGQLEFLKKSVDFKFILTTP